MYIFIKYLNAKISVIQLHPRFQALIVYSSYRGALVKFYQVSPKRI